MRYLRRSAWAGAATLLMAAALTVGISAQKPKTRKDKDQKDADPRPKLTLRANPVIAMAPARVVLTAELNGGANDYEEFYCPAVEWEWGDGTKSESSSDCAPYEPGKSEIKRRFTVEHVFRAGHVSRDVPPEAPRQGGRQRDHPDPGAPGPPRRSLKRSRPRRRERGPTELCALRSAVRSMRAKAGRVNPGTGHRSGRQLLPAIFFSKSPPTRLFRSGMTLALREACLFERGSRERCSGR